jgi:hypothetical protein
MEPELEVRLALAQAVRPVRLALESPQRLAEWPSPEARVKPEREERRKSLAQLEPAGVQ